MKTYELNLLRDGGGKFPNTCIPLLFITVIHHQLTNNGVLHVFYRLKIFSSHALFMES